MSSYADWVLDSLPDDFRPPPLPTISDESLRHAVITHKGHPGAGFEEHSHDRAYNKYAFQGNALLHLSVTSFLKEICPDLQPGPASVLRAQLTSHQTLARLSDIYHLPSRLRAERSALPMLRDQTRVKAALFEAHVGGLYEQARWRCGVRGTHGQAIDEVDIWLRGIYLPLATWARRSLEELRAEVDESSEAQAEIDIWRMGEGATAKLHDHVMHRLKWPVPTYEVDRPNPGGPEAAWRAICRVKDTEGRLWHTSIGSGRSVLSSKRLAALKACQEMGLL